MRNKIFKITYFLAAALILSSCLKDKVGEDWTSSLKGKMYAEVWSAGFKTQGLQPTTAPDTIKFLVNIASDALPTSDITLTIGVNDDARLKYNALKGTSYLLYPNIEVLNPTVVIKAGTRNAYVHVKVWGANTLNPCDNFMAPISIMTASNGVVVADPLNMGSRLMGLPIANPYAGDYDVVGYRVHPVNGVYTVAAGQVETLSTVNCETVIKHLMGDYPYDVTIKVDLAHTIIVAGITCYKVITHVIDPATGDIVSSGDGMQATFTGNLAYPPLPVTNDVNYYNPISKKFVLNYFYNSGAPRIAYETLTRK